MPQLNSQDIGSYLKTASDVFEGFLAAVIIPFIRERAVSSVADPMIYSLEAGGKRIRPALCMLHAGLKLEPGELWKDDYVRRVLFACAAVESIHTYSLIHDDLPAIDNDDLRRGKPSCHIQFSEWEAILAGDALNTLAFELLLDAAQDGADLELVRILSRAAGISGMVCGQALDLKAERNTDDESLKAWSQEQLLNQVHTRKTAALIRASCELGAWIGGVRDLQPCRDYGESLGLLFQISDDMLDVSGDSATLGKTAGKDQAQGKLTFPALYGMEKSGERAEELAGKIAALSEEMPRGSEQKVDTRPLLAALPELIRKRNT